MFSKYIFHCHCLRLCLEPRAARGAKYETVDLEIFFTAGDQKALMSLFELASIWTQWQSPPLVKMHIYETKRQGGSNKFKKINNTKILESLFAASFMILKDKVTDTQLQVCTCMAMSKIMLRLVSPCEEKERVRESWSRRVLRIPGENTFTWCDSGKDGHYYTQGKFNLPNRMIFWEFFKTAYSLPKKYPIC